MFIEPHIHDTAADRNARAGGRGLHNYLSEHTQPFVTAGPGPTNTSILDSIMRRPKDTMPVFTPYDDTEIVFR